MHAHIYFQEHRRALIFMFSLNVNALVFLSFIFEIIHFETIHKYVYALYYFQWPYGILLNQYPTIYLFIHPYFLKILFIYLFLERGEGRRKECDHLSHTSLINVWLPLARPQLGTWPATPACAPAGNQTHDLLVCRPALNPLSHTSQGFSFTLDGLICHHRNML